MPVYTRAGDTGRASTLTRQNIPKNSPIFEVLGTLDELNSCLGLAKQEAAQFGSVLEQLQQDIISVSGELAGGEKFSRLDRVTQLERAIDALEEKIPPFKEFVLPGGSRGGAALDVARTVARRAERCTVAASQSGGISREMLAWLNRLSDLLYVMARLCDHTTQITPAPVKTAQATSASMPGFCGRAMELCRAVQQHAASQGVQVVTAVCDAGGNPVAMLRADDAYIASVDIAMNKAFTSVSLKMSTEELGRLAQPGQSLYGIQFTNNQRIVIFGGGVPLLYGDQVVGGFGVSGGTAAQDTAFGSFAKEYFEKEMG